MGPRKSNYMLKKAKEVLQIEADGILGIIDKLSADFVVAVKTVLKSKGRVIVTGIGKSGIVGRKIVATLNSTGTPALFLHPVEAMHGDLGMVTKKDVILAISNSGETGEINILIPSFKHLGAPLIAFTGNSESTLARHSDVVVNVGVKREACPLGLAPTTSTTAALAMGDALAVALLEGREFSADDFRRFHPGGSLGKRLTLKIEEAMRKVKDLPVIKPQVRLSTIITQLAEADIVWVVAYNRLKGIIDAKVKAKLLLKEQNELKRMFVQEVFRPIETVNASISLGEALETMQKYSLDTIGVTDKRGYFVGALFLKDLIKKVNFSFLRNNNVT
jgi:arabinose-5-phosphate isomerase